MRPSGGRDDGGRTHTGRGVCLLLSMELDLGPLLIQALSHGYSPPLHPTTSALRLREFPRGFGPSAVRSMAKTILSKAMIGGSWQMDPADIGFFTTRQLSKMDAFFKGDKAKICRFSGIPRCLVLIKSVTEPRTNIPIPRSPARCFCRVGGNNGRDVRSAHPHIRHWRIESP